MYDRILELLIEARNLGPDPLNVPKGTIPTSSKGAKAAAATAGPLMSQDRAAELRRKMSSSSDNPFKPASNPSGNKPNDKEIEAYRRKHLGRESGRSYGTHSMSDKEYLDYRAKHPANPRNWSKEDPDSEEYKNQETAFLQQQNKERGFFKRKKQVDALVASPAIGGRLGAMVGRALTPNYNPARVGRTPRSFM